MGTAMLGLLVIGMLVGAVWWWQRPPSRRASPELEEQMREAFWSEVEIGEYASSGIADIVIFLHEQEPPASV